MWECGFVFVRLGRIAMAWISGVIVGVLGSIEEKSDENVFD